VNFHGLSDAQFDESGNFVDDDGNDDNGEEQNIKIQMVMSPSNVP